MTHERTRAALQAYADGQVRWPRRWLIARHVAHCPSCLAELEAISALRTVVRTRLTTHRAPPGLAARIGSALPREAVARGTVPVSLVPRWGFAGSGLLGIVAGVALTLAVVHRGAPNPLVADAVADSVRSMMEGHLVDVQTSNQHTVKPWLSARLDLSPVVEDFASEGFPLVGGRLDYLDGHRAAAMVYRRDRHVINLFAFVSAAPEDRALLVNSRDGFHVVRWRMGGLEYVAVSDVEVGQLLAFCRLVKAA